VIYFDFKLQVSEVDVERTLSFVLNILFTVCQSLIYILSFSLFFES